jgi:Fe-S-cluster containining protein
MEGVMQKEVKVDECSTCPGHCCKVFQVGGMNKEKAMQQAQNTAMSLMYRKDALKFARWMEPTTCRATELLDPGVQYYRCTKLVDGKCSVYNARPNFCKTFSCRPDPSLMWADITDKDIERRLEEKNSETTAKENCKEKQ